MKKIFGAIGLASVMLVAMSYIPRLRPPLILLGSPLLKIHTSDAQINRVSVIPPYIPERPYIDGNSDTTIVSPVFPGPYRVSAEYKDGQVICIEFIRHDADARKHIDLHLSGDPNVGSIIISYLVNDDDLLYVGEVRPNDTGEDRPFVIPK